MKENSYSVKNVLSRIDTCVLHSKGIFLKTSVITTRGEIDGFKDYCRRHPGAFKLVLKEGSSIYQATQAYAAMRNLQLAIPSQLTAIETARSAIWSAFLVAQHLSNTDSHERCLHNPSTLTLDDLKSDYQSFGDILITYPTRAKVLACQTFIPISLKSKWSTKLLDALLGEKISDQKAPNHDPNLLETNMLENGIWPDYDYECHADKRHYPTIEQAMSGLTKWTLDKHLLANNGQINPGYKFGIHRI